jgi:regulatory protein
MIISAIKQQEKLKGRYSVFVDGKYAFSLSDTALLDARLTQGQELTGEELKSYKQLSVDDKVYGNALRYAAMRLRSRWELESYLQRKQASPDLAKQIMDKLEHIGMIDDLAFARAWVENRHLLRPTSRRKLQQELQVKRVPSDIIQQVLQADETTDSASLKEIIERKRRQTKYQDNLKLMQYLAGQGYGYGDIKSALQAETDDEITE